MTPDLKALADFFPASDVEWKPGATSRDKTKGLAMAYVSNRAIMQRLDDVCGPAGWRNEYRSAPEGGVLCGISIRVTYADGAVEWVTKWDGAENTDVEAVKGGLSGAMKRAGYQWGIGRYLYELPSVWVRLDERGRFAEPPRIPAEFLPARQDRHTPAAPTPRPRLSPAQDAVRQAMTRTGMTGQLAVDALARYGAEGLSQLSDADADALLAEITAAAP